jgi:hypothetical protein
MNTYCPHDQHIRALDPQKPGQLRCNRTDCQCAECHRSVSPQERGELLGKK